MQVLLIWFAAAIVIVTYGVRSRRRLVDIWPASVFAILPAMRASILVSLLSALPTGSLREYAAVAQSLASLAFLILLVTLFVIRSQVRGPRASAGQGVVAILGTFILMFAAALPTAADASTTNLLLSSAFALAGTLFAIWGLVALGRCFGIFPEVRGLVVRGPYRWVRHPVYVGEIVAAAGTLFARPHPLTVAFFVIFLGLQYWRTLYEERTLVAAFPMEYSAYRNSVPRLVPGVQRLIANRLPERVAA
jgi:protein-S-isoprenylcysteine O-methyltransferase Ste14